MPADAPALCDCARVSGGAADAEVCKTSGAGPATETEDGRVAGAADVGAVSVAAAFAGAFAGAVEAAVGV